MKTVKEPDVEETRECRRCNQSHCKDCVDYHTVDFDILDSPEGYNQKDIQWEGIDVCPWCYNQLLNLKGVCSESAEEVSKNDRR